MHSKRVRMIDVAQAAGVSRTTASFVLNGRKASIPDETQRRVKRFAEQMGYRPNMTARALATGRTQRIGVILNEPRSFDSKDYYFSNILTGVMAGALRCNYNLLLHSAQFDDWSALRDDILGGSSDGTLLIGRYVDDRLTPVLLDAEIPCVCVSFHIDHPDCWTVDCDNEQGGWLAASHLLRLGHRRIAFFYPGDEASWGRERRIGMFRALAEAGCDPTAVKIYSWPETGTPDEEWVKAACRQMLAVPERPTAVICCDDWRASMVLDELQRSELRVPEEMALVSFNSTERCASCRPSLTSVWQPMYEIGIEAVSLLVDLIEGRTPQEQIRRLGVRLDIRESCGA